MDTASTPNEITGKTLRFTWKDGPTEGQVHDHRFHEDGTVQRRTAPAEGEAARAFAGERPPFLNEGIADGIRLVSYRADSGHTLTVVLNFNTRLIAGVASNGKTWTPVHGAFEAVV